MNRLLLVIVALVALLWPRDAHAIPAFARKQQVGCPVCHTAFPELNPMGRAFKENGYRFAAGPGGQVVTTGIDLGNGIVLDAVPGLAVRVESVPIALEPARDGRVEVGTTPLDAVELLLAGSNGDHWSYFAEVGAEADGDYAAEGNAVVMYRFASEITIFAGWTPMFSRDAYNTLNEARRIDHVRHAVQSYTGSTGLDMNTESGLFGGYGRFGSLYYLVEAGPGPGAPAADGEPFDYLGRLAWDFTPDLSIGGFVYAGAGAKGGTVRPGLDLSCFGDAGNFKAAAMYDSADGALLGEVGWDLVRATGKVWLVPLAHADLVVSEQRMVVTPAVGFGVQQAAGRIQVEVSEPLGPSGPPPPTVRVSVDAAF